MITSSDNSLFQYHIRNKSKFVLPLQSNSPIENSLSTTEQQKRDKLPIEPTTLLVHPTYLPGQNSCASSVDIKNMFPFPYYPYSYVNFDSKENVPPQAFAPYFVPPAIHAGMIPNFHSPATSNAETNAPTSNHNPAVVTPPLPIHLFNSLPRPTFMPGASIPTEAPQFGPGPPIVTGERLKGPRGCNLFVFHLPNEITNWDLYLLFRRFGTILSVHIMVNKSTGLSKGYGFVSFAFAEDAAASIELMDGFRLGKKRLKVQLKRLQDDCMDDDTHWMDRPDGESNCNSSSSDSTLPVSPTTSRRVRKIFSSTSSDGVHTDIAIELGQDDMGSPIRADTETISVTKFKPKTVIVSPGKQPNAPPRA